MSWQEHAACHGKIELFFPAESGGRGGADYGAEARAICATCPVIGDCWREHHDERHGIFFGTTPAMRGTDRPSRSVQQRVRKRDQACCAHGHPMTPENTYIRADGFGACRECNRLHHRRYRTDEKSALSTSDPQEPSERLAP